MSQFLSGDTVRIMVGEFKDYPGVFIYEHEGMNFVRIPVSEKVKEFNWDLSEDSEINLNNLFKFNEGEVKHILVSEFPSDFPICKYGPNFSFMEKLPCLKV